MRYLGGVHGIEMDPGLYIRNMQRKKDRDQVAGELLVIYLCRYQVGIYIGGDTGDGDVAVVQRGQNIVQDSLQAR